VRRQSFRPPGHPSYEAGFRDIPGVLQTDVGYTGEATENPDVGTQYWSSVFFHDEQQRAVAEASKARAQARSTDPIVTGIVPEKPFFRAEDDHQRYLEKQGLQSCRI
jgi:peptide methionine sulfoxide reductase MsrA